MGTREPRVVHGHAHRPQTAVVISRTEEITAARLELPVVQEEQKIMEAIQGIVNWTVANHAELAKAREEYDARPDPAVSAAVEATR